MTGNAPRLDRASLTRGQSIGGALDRAIGEFSAAAVRARAVDPVTTELVRLRCAQVHDCRLCGSLRYKDALDMGFDEAMQRKIGCYETSDFSPATIAALRLCDALILMPWTADDTLRDELHRHFSDEQIAELCLDVMKWSYQKALVALRLEEPPWNTTTVLSFDADGEPVFGGAAYA